MSKQNIIDYSNTVIYKIFCKDPTIKDVYVGHTTNFHKRLLQHKTICNKVLNNTLKVYEFIREHGGWDNWDMVEIAKYNCKDRSEATLKEHEHFVSTNSTLNTNFPVSIHKFQCVPCDVICSKKSNYDRHLTTSKHKLISKLVTNHIQSNSNAIEKCSTETPQKKSKHTCECGKVYKFRQGLHYHKKSCQLELLEHSNSSQRSQEKVVSLFTQAMKDIFAEQTTAICKTLSTLKSNKFDEYEDTTNILNL